MVCVSVGHLSGRVGVGSVLLLTLIEPHILGRARPVLFAAACAASCTRLIPVRPRPLRTDAPAPSALHSLPLSFRWGLVLAFFFEQTSNRPRKPIQNFDGGKRKSGYEPTPASVWLVVRSRGHVFSQGLYENISHYLPSDPIGIQFHQQKQNGA